jgi:Flp pilus assembly protein TadG
VILKILRGSKLAIFEERGSASVEFVALAIPLFIPLFIFINSFASATDGQDALRTLAREAVRGFVTSSNDEIAYGVAHEIVTKGAGVLGYSDAVKNGAIEMHIVCSERPCISPNSGIRITVTLREKGSSAISASAIGYVSPWA